MKAKTICDEMVVYDYCNIYQQENKTDNYNGSIVIDCCDMCDSCDNGW